MESIKHTYLDGTIMYHNEEDQLHREDGPAMISPDGYQEWFINDKYHREDGPAIITSDDYKEYWLNGKEYSHEEWLKLVKPTSTTKPNVINLLVENNIDFCKSGNTITIKMED